MDDLDVQLNQTVSCETLQSDLTKLILEELRCFRQEMREEVRKLSLNVQNYLVSKVDVVNAILENSTLFSDHEHISEDGATMTTYDHNAMKFQKGKMDASFNRENISHALPFPAGSRLEAPYGRPSASMNEEIVVTPSDAEDEMSSANASLRDVCEKSSQSVNVYVNQTEKNEIGADDCLMTKYFPGADGYPGYPTKVVHKPIGLSSMAKMSLSKSHNRMTDTASFTRQKSYIKKTMLIPHNRNIKDPKEFSDVLKQNSVESQKSSPGNVAKVNQLTTHLKQKGLLDARFVARLKHKCKFCEKTFLSVVDLKRHVMLHTGDRPFQCEYCSKSYTRNDHLKRHVKQKHVEEVALMKNMKSVPEPSSTGKEVELFLDTGE